MRFEEHSYHKKNKIYWHGSLYPYYNEDLAKFKYFFITPDFEYAARYAVDRYRLEFKYMYRCTLRKPLNIFNPRNSCDEFLFKKRFNPSREEFNLLKEEMWLGLLGLEERERIVDAIQLLGYDGFFNFEHNKQGASLGIFDAGNVSIDKIYEGQEISDFIKANKDLCSRRNRQMKSLEESCFKIYPSLLTKDDFKNILNVDFDFERKYEKILQKRRERKLEKSKARLKEYLNIDKKDPLYDNLLRNYELYFEDLQDMMLSEGNYCLDSWESYVE